MKSLTLSIIAIAVFLFSSCAKKSMANQQTLVTADCGTTWKLIAPGQSIPNCKINCQCSYDISLPNYPMQGNANFKFAFKGNVLAEVEISYDYEITDPLLFIKEAKYLGKPNNSETTGLSDKNFELAENSVIDVRIREVAREILSGEDVVTVSPADVEDKIFKAVNIILAERGVILNSLSLVTKFDGLTATAIDRVTANKIYNNHGMDINGNVVYKTKDEVKE